MDYTQQLGTASLNSNGHFVYTHLVVFMHRNPILTQKAKKPHMVLQFSGVSIEVHTVSISNAVGDAGLSYPGCGIAWVQGLGYGECLVGQLEECMYVCVFCCMHRLMVTHSKAHLNVSMLEVQSSQISPC